MSADTHYKLGFVYANFENKQNLAVLHYKMAAWGNHTESEAILGYRHHYGISVEQSCVLSVSYNQKVARKIINEYNIMEPYKNKESYVYEDQERGYNGLFGPGSLKELKKQSEEDTIEYYKYLAENGDTQAQYYLGITFYQGSQMVKKHYGRAMRYFSMASTATSSKDAKKIILASHSCALIGKLYLFGEGVVQNNDTAIKWFEKAAKFNNAMAISFLAIMNLDQKINEKQSILDLKSAASSGRIEAQGFLGKYFFELGFIEDSIKYLSNAMSQGCLQSMFLMAEIYLHGLGKPKSCSFANQLYQTIIKRGLKPIKYKTETQDDELMVHLLMAERGFESSQANFAFLASKSPFFSKLALQNWIRSGNQNNALSRIKVGDLFFYGDSVNQSYEKASEYYRLAAENEKNALAMWNLATMYHFGYGVQKNLDLAKQFYQRSLDANPDGWFPCYLSLKLISIQTYFTKTKTEHEDWEWEEVKKPKLQKKLFSQDLESGLVFVLCFVIAYLVYIRNR